MLTKERVDELVQMDKGRIQISLYTDEAIFEEEMQNIFYKTWVFIGHTSEISQPGDYKTTYIGRIPVILSRDENGEIHVLINRCAHRGPAVCQYEYGNANFFRCEYHGWVYANDGSLAGVSLRRGFGPGEIDDIQGGLDKAPRVEVYRGLVFASLSPEGISLNEHLGGAKKYLDEWSDQSVTGEVEISGGIWKHTYVGNWKLQLEGSNEGYHAPYLHKISALVQENVSGQRAPSMFGKGAAKGPEVRGFDLGHGHSLMESGAPGTGTAWRRMPKEYLDQLSKRLDEEQMQQVLGSGWRMQLFPNAAFNPGNLRVIRPISVDKTEIYQYHVAIPGATDAMNAARVAGHQSFYGPAGYGAPDDIEMFARMQEGYRSAALASLNPWALFSRGLTSEYRGPNGERIAHVTSEVEQRAIYHAWTELMKGKVPSRA